LLTIKYKLSTKQELFFFDAKKEPKKLFGNPPERFKVVFYSGITSLHLNIPYLYTSLYSLYNSI